LRAIKRFVGKQQQFLLSFTHTHTQMHMTKLASFFFSCRDEREERREGCFYEDIKFLGLKKLNFNMKIRVKQIIAKTFIFMSKEL
jgi:hypothetical protein